VAILEAEERERAEEARLKQEQDELDAQCLLDDTGSRSSSSSHDAEDNEEAQAAGKANSGGNPDRSSLID